MVVAAEAEERKPEFYLPVWFPEPRNERGPCPRNREIFDAVRVRNQSYRATAKEFSLSPARIGQIVKEVTGWIERTGGGPPRTWAERDRLNEYVHRARLEMLYSDALVAWKKSDQTVTTRYQFDPEHQLKGKTVAVRATPGLKAYWDAALKCENARYAFEKSRPKPPNPEELTPAERLRELDELAQESLRQREAEEGISNPNDQVPMTNDVLVLEPPVEPVAEVIAEIPRAEPVPEPVEELQIADPPYDGRGRLRLTKVPANEALLDRFWVMKRGGNVVWRGPVIVSSDRGRVFFDFDLAPPGTESKQRAIERFLAESEREEAERDRDADKHEENGDGEPRA